MAEKKLIGRTIYFQCTCGKDIPVEVPALCPDCEVKREGILDQAGIDFDCPEWLARQAREHPAQDVTPIKTATPAKAGP